uniref:Uncharacterized protein n=1 Tax=Oryza brachyantha TaxID=4533 RepID=J3MAF8_ORYBR
MQNLSRVSMAVVMEKNPRLCGLSYTNLGTHCWRPWRGCSMSVFLQRVEGVDNIKMMSLVKEIQVLEMVFVTILEMVMVVMVVVGMLVVTINMGEDLTDVVVVTVCIFMMMIMHECFSMAPTFEIGFLIFDSYAWPTSLGV